MFCSGSTNLIDALMPTLRNYDENGLLKSATEQNERLTSFDLFMQELDDEYDKRQRAKNKTIQNKLPEEKQITATAPKPSTPLTLDGPIEYRDKKKKQSSSIKKTKSQQSKKRIILSSSSSENENEEIDSSQMIYDEDEAW